MTRPSVTANALLEHLLQDGTLTPSAVISLLGPARHDPTLNDLEMALVRENVLSAGELARRKGQLAGVAILDPALDQVTTNLPELVALSAGALVVSRPVATVAMVEDTEENLRMVSDAAGGARFEVLLTTAPQFAELYAAAYHHGPQAALATSPDVFGILDAAVAQRASDIHLKVGVPPTLRVDGGLRRLPYQPLSHTWMAEQIAALAAPRHLRDLEEKFSTDLAYTFGTAGFRVNIATDLHGSTMVLRKLPSKVPTFDELNIPEAIRRFVRLEKGLVLVTGPTGSGKSTTLAAIINDILNEERHVITLEDPIEFRFPVDKAGFINQRELHSSLASFPDGIRDALRQDPEVCLVGEMRDPETIKTALDLAETGHLVFGTLHSSSAAGTVSRIVNSFSADEQDAVRAQLGQQLKGVVSQTLLPRAASKGRVAAYEIMVSTTAIAQNLRKTDGANQLKQTMATSAKDGMATMEMALAKLVHDGLVSKEEAAFRAADQGEFEGYLAHLSAAA